MPGKARKASSKPARKAPKPRLMVALDQMNLDRALEMAREAVEGGADILEAGTPLIKSEGLEAVRALRKAFPDTPIFADMKTADTGALECEMAVKAGASLVGILGAASDETIVEAVRSGAKYGAEIVVDMIGVPDLVERAKRAEALGAGMVSLHIGIDEQMRGEADFAFVQDVAAAVSIPVVVAGGLNSETAPEVAALGASVVVVGGAITKAKDIRKAVGALQKALATGKPAASRGMKRYDASRVREALLACSTPNLSDAMHRAGVLRGLKPAQTGAKVAGPVLTVATKDGDWAKPVEAIDQAEPGTVLVIDAQGGETAVWGELASHTCKEKGIAAVVVDGAVRDVDEIREIGFPSWSRHVVPNAGDPKGFGEIGVEIVCGGQRVRTGDWVLCDDNGVVVIPRAELVEIANRGVEVKEQEDRLRSEIERGETLSKVLKLKKWEKVIG